MEIDVRHVATLARLKIDENKVDAFTKEMTDILKMVENLPPLESKGALLDPENTMCLRADIVEESYPREEILRNAPKQADGCFLVPQTVE